VATMLPPQPPLGTSRPEKHVFTGLSKLPGDWTVFHSVCWFGLEREGEGDFIIVSPAGGLIFVEVKPTCDVDESGQWTRRKGSVPVKDPWEQAKVTGREVVARLKKAGVPRRPAAYVACFPFGEPRFVGGLARQQERSLSAADLASLDRLLMVLESALNEAASRDRMPLARFTATELETVRTILLVTGQVHIPLPTAVAHLEEHRLDLTQEQTETYVELMCANRLLTIGGAGTGKTILAAARAAQLSRQGLSVIVIAAHGLLSQRIDHLVGRNGGDQRLVQVFSLTQLAAWVEVPVYSDPGVPGDLLDDRFWRSALAATPFRADALIIDDTQHFSVNLVDAWTSLLSDPAYGSIYFFADPNQAMDSNWLYDLEAVLPPHAKVALRRNCRNTRQICSLVADLFPRPVEPSDIEGPEVRFAVTQEPGEAVNLARESAEFLLEEGLVPNSVAILYDDLSWYRYLWKKPDLEVDNTQDKEGYAKLSLKK
jgi:Nuclease-related domain/AAA domain